MAQLVARLDGIEEVEGSSPSGSTFIYFCLRKFMSIKDYQKELDNWFKEKGWKYWQALSILARLYEECGEFARLVNHLYGEKVKRRDEEGQELEEEIGDILYTLICFANSHDVDLDKAIRKSFDKVMKLDHGRYNDKKKE